MLKKNSHDWPEIELPSSQIFFSGSEDSVEKMEIISTQFSLELNYDRLYKESFEQCQNDFDCSQKVPSLIQTVNQITDSILERKDLSNAEKNQMAEEWMAKVLF